jgi:hypothetical protein
MPNSNPVPTCQVNIDFQCSLEKFLRDANQLTDNEVYTWIQVLISFFKINYLIYHHCYHSKFSTETQFWGELRFYPYVDQRTLYMFHGRQDNFYPFLSFQIRVVWFISALFNSEHDSEMNYITFERWTNLLRHYVCNSTDYELEVLFTIQKCSNKQHHFNCKVAFCFQFFLLN